MIPQWQGYAADDGPLRGARAIAAVVGGSERLHHIDVPGWHPLPREAERAMGQLLGLTEIVGQAAAALDWLEATVPARLLVIGGDCGSDFAPMIWQAARFGDDLGVLYLDAHADLNTPGSSPSGRFHGMVLRAALGEGAPALTALGQGRLTAAQIVMAGTRDLDAAERDFLDRAAIQPWSPAAISDGRVVAAVRGHRATRWHVHFDLDVLDPMDFPEVTVPTPGGATLAAAGALLVELVAQVDVVSIAITEHVGGDASARRIAELVAGVRRTGWC